MSKFSEAKNRFSKIEKPSGFCNWQMTEKSRFQLEHWNLKKGDMVQSCIIQFWAGDNGYSIYTEEDTNRARIIEGYKHLVKLVLEESANGGKISPELTELLKAI